MWIMVSNNNEGEIIRAKLLLFFHLHIDTACKLKELLTIKGQPMNHTGG